MSHAASVHVHVHVVLLVLSGTRTRYEYPGNYQAGGAKLGKQLPRVESSAVGVPTIFEVLLRTASQQ